MKQLITDSPERTKEFSKNFAKDLKPPKILALYGNLGSGKTTFIQGLAAGLGIKKRILSPTFVFIRRYDLSGGLKFYHVDLYRLDSERDVEAIGLKEILEEKAIIAIEWPEKVEKLLPEDSIKIKLETIGESKRKIQIS